MKSKRNAGYTVVELMVVVAIMSVLAGFASLSMNLIRKERIRSASRELFTDLQRLRYQAMIQNEKGMGIRFESNSTYVLFTFDDCDHDYEYDADACEHAGREETGVVRKTLDSAVELKKNNPSTDPSNDILIFDRFGMPRTKTWAQNPMKLILMSPSDPDCIHCVVISLNRIREGTWTGSGCKIE